MAMKNGRYSVVQLGVHWTGTSVRDARVAMAKDSAVTWGEIAAHLPDEDKVVSFPARPTQQEVDGYINSLEFEASQEVGRMCQRAPNTAANGH